MKYIRTKDGIFEVVKEDGEWLEIISNFARKMQCHCVIKKFAVIDQADTIEELCDEFVMFCPNVHRRKIRVYKTMSSISLYFKRDERWNGNMVDKVYGAIWTDIGLIYVAKMNKKGELELL